MPNFVFFRSFLTLMIVALVLNAGVVFAIDAERINPLRLQLDSYTNQLLSTIENNEGLKSTVTLQNEFSQIINSVPAIEQLLEAEKRLKAQLKNAMSGFYPQASLTLSRGKRDSDDGLNGRVVGDKLNFQQLLFDFGSLNSSVKSTEDANNAIRANIAVKRSEIFLDLINAQINLAKEEQLFLLSEVFLDSRERFADYIRERLELGSASKADLTRANAQVLSAKGKLPDAIYRLEAAKKDYEELYGVAPLRGNWFDLSRAKNINDITLELETHPKFINAKLSYDSAKNKLDSLKSAQWGRFTADVSHNQTDSPGNSFSKYSDASINYSVTLFSGGAQDAQIAEARTALAEAGFELERVKRELNASVSKGFVELGQKLKGLSLKVESLKAAREATQSVQDLFIYGRASMTDVISAQRDELDASTSLVEVFSDYQQSFFSVLHETHHLLDLVDVYI